MLEFEVDPTTTASVVVLDVIPNGFNPFTTFVTNAACVFAEKKVFNKILGIDQYLSSCADYDYS